MITFVVHVENKPGVLTRVASLFRRRAYNIESLTVGHTEAPGVSRMTIVVDTDDEGAHHVEAHLYKLVNVLRVENVTARPNVTRELALIKVSTSAGTRPEIFQLADVFRARIIDVSADSLVLELTGGEAKLDRLLEVLEPYGVLEMARTGTLAMARGEGAPTAAATGAAGREGVADAHHPDVSYSV
jgi:acetolactate synthase-1/3 small subunit